MIVKGHGLCHEGAAHDENGSYLGRYMNRIGGGVSVNGYGFCSCGVRSALLESTAARKRWHRAHKSVVAWAEDNRIISARTAIIRIILSIILYVLVLVIYKVLIIYKVATWHQ